MTIEPLFSKHQIQDRVSELAKILNSRFPPGHEFVAVCVLNGAIFFYCDLIKKLHGSVICDFIGVRSYDKEVSSGELTFTKSPQTIMKDQDVVLIEDIVDTGLTMHQLEKHFLQKEKVGSFFSATLIKRAIPQKHSCKVDFEGFSVKSKEFLVGYGLDYDARFRNLDFIGEIHLQ